MPMEVFRKTRCPSVQTSNNITMYNTPIPRTKYECMLSFICPKRDKNIYLKCIFCLLTV